MAGGIAVRDIHGVLPRIIPNGSLEQIIFRVDLLHRLEAEGTRVMNSARAIERSVDKAWTSALLEQAGLPTPDTVVCERSEDAFVALREMGDVVVKPLFGSMGLGMMRVSDEDTAFRVFRAIEMTRGVFYLQRFIPHDGADIRAFVVGDKVIGAIYRSAPGWKTNVSRGGTGAALLAGSGARESRREGSANSRRRVRRSRPAPGARRNGLRPRSKRNPGLAGTPRGDRQRCGWSDRGSVVTARPTSRPWRSSLACSRSARPSRAMSLPECGSGT